jgi:hypothetical protein
VTRRITALIPFLILALAGSASAQRNQENELTVFGGISLLNAETSRPRNPVILEAARDGRALIFPPPFLSNFTSVDASGEFGVRYGRDITDTVTLVGDFAIAPAHELSEEVVFGCPEGQFCIAAPGSIVAPNVRFSERVVAYHYGGGLQLNFGRTQGLLPSVIAGLGGVTYSTPAAAHSQFALRLGGRVAASMGRLTTSIDVFDAIVTDHFVTGEVEHDVHVRIGFGVRF